MKTLFKGLALLLLIACAVWLPVLWHWQRTLRDVNTADVVYWLIVLPLLLFAGLLLLLWAWRAVVLPARAAAAAAASAAASAPGAAGGAGGAPGTAGNGGAVASAAAQAQRPVQLLAAALNLPGAASAAALEDALREQAVQPQPDAELTDEEGLPVHTARLSDLDLDVIAAQPEVLLAQPRILRALAAMAPVLEEIVQALPARQDGAAPMHLRVLLHLPGDTPAEDCERAHAWAQSRLQASAPEWAAGLQLRVLGGPVLGLWQQAEQLLAALAQEARADLLLLCAAHSELDGDLLARWGDQRQLFHAQRQPRGRMPGEGAAALLIAPPGLAAAGRPVAELHRAAWAERRQPVDAPGRVSSETLESVIATVLSAAQIPPERLPGLSCDVDRHGARNGELFSAVIARLPQLDAMQDVRALGAACGHQGAVGLLASVALAAHAVSQPAPPDGPAASPCLVLNLDDPRWRLGLLVSTPAEPAPST